MRTVNRSMRGAWKECNLSKKPPAPSTSRHISHFSNKSLIRFIFTSTSNFQTPFRISPKAIARRDIVTLISQAQRTNRKRAVPMPSLSRTQRPGSRSVYYLLQPLNDIIFFSYHEQNALPHQDGLPMPSWIPDTERASCMWIRWYLYVGAANAIRGRFEDVSFWCLP